MSADRSWTLEAVRDLGLTTDVEPAGSILGIGRSRAYPLTKAGEFPVRVLRVGRSYVVSRPTILEALGIGPGENSEPSGQGRGAGDTRHGQMTVK